MNKLRHPVGGLVIVAILVSLSLTFYSAMQAGYGFSESYEAEYDGQTMTILEHIQTLGILEAVQTWNTAIGQLASPSGIADLVGGLLTAGLGVLKTISGLITFPFEILNILGTFYNIPPIITNGLIVLFTTYVSFIILSATIGRDI